MLMAPINLAIPWCAYTGSGIWPTIVLTKCLLAVSSVFAFTSAFLLTNNAVVASERGKVNGLSMAVCPLA